MRLLLLLIPLLFICTLSTGQIYYVSPGASGGNGTLERPFGTISEAVDKLPKATKRMNSDIQIVLRAGTHIVSQPIFLGKEHGGKNGFSVIFKAYDKEQPVISGGVQVSGWMRVEGTIFKAKLNRDVKLRSLFVDGKRMRMAGTDEPIKAMGNWGKFQVNGDEPWSFGPGEGIDGIKFLASDVKEFRNPEDIELVQFNIWTEKILCARGIETIGDTAIIRLQQPYGAIATNMAWAGAINYKKEFVVRNVFELLDSPGEFYFDRKTKELYYYGEGDEILTAEVIAPTSSGLFDIKGSSTSSKVENIRFEDMTFSHDDWQLMDVAGSKGFAGIQSLGLAVKFISDGNWHPTKYNSTDVPRGAIQVENARNIDFIRNRFERMGSAIAVNLMNDVQDSDVTGNYFHDLLGNAVNIGHPQHYEIGDGDLYPKGVEGLCSNIRVSNNYLRNIGLDFRQMEGIVGFFAENVTIDHNDIRYSPYGAIAFGWWWGNAGIPPSKMAKNNRIAYNRCGDTHQVLDDGGIIYVLGEQPGSVMEENYVFNGPRCLYPDDGSAYWIIRRNVVDNVRYKLWLHLWTKRVHDITAVDNFVHDNMFLDNGTNTKISGTQVYREREFDGEALKIIEASGIEAAYKDIMPDAEPEILTIHPKGFREIDRFH